MFLCFIWLYVCEFSVVGVPETAYAVLGSLVGVNVNGPQLSIARDNGAFLGRGHYVSIFGQFHLPDQYFGCRKWPPGAVVSLIQGALWLPVVPVVEFLLRGRVETA